MMLLFTRRLPRLARSILAVVVLICFGGMDLIPAILSKNWGWSALSITFDLGCASGIDLSRDTEFWLNMERLQLARWQLYVQSDVAYLSISFPPRCIPCCWSSCTGSPAS